MPTCTANGTKNEMVKLSSQKGPWEGMTRTVTGAVILTFCCGSLLPESERESERKSARQGLTVEKTRKGECDHDECSRSHWSNASSLMLPKCVQVHVGESVQQ